MIEWFRPVGYNRLGGKTMTAEQAISDISALPFDEQLRVVRAIWSNLPESTTLALSGDARRELDRRVARYTADPSTLLTEAQFREKMRASDQ
jgi:putative addiction module component (TIGR02574 family)